MSLHGCSVPNSKHYYLYRIWCGMMQRCYRATDPRSIKHYQKKRIRVCSRWHDPSAFMADILRIIGERPSIKHSIDRIQNAGNYEPNNVRWATQTVQNRNKDNNRLLTAFGMQLCGSEWAERLRISNQDLFSMLRNKNIEDIITSLTGNDFDARPENEHKIIEPYDPDDLPNFDDWEIHQYLSKRIKVGQSCQI